MVWAFTFLNRLRSVGCIIQEWPVHSGCAGNGHISS